MEVHHHSKEHPKNWKEHFKEFFMMFLAVMLGFCRNQKASRGIVKVLS